jgi:hypothetical protein
MVDDVGGWQVRGFVLVVVCAGWIEGCRWIEKVCSSERV